VPSTDRHCGRASVRRPARPDDRRRPSAVTLVNSAPRSARCLAVPKHTTISSHIDTRGPVKRRPMAAATSAAHLQLRHRQQQQRQQQQSNVGNGRLRCDTAQHRRGHTRCAVCSQRADSCRPCARYRHAINSQYASNRRTAQRSIARA